VTSVPPVLKCFAGAWARVGVVTVALACNTATSGQGPSQQLPRDGATYWPAATDWRRAEPGQVGLDATQVAALVQALRTNAIPGLHSLIVVRHGYVAVEEYFNGSSATQVHTMQSVTKSVTSLVAGIAVGEGKLAAGARIFDILPQYDSLIRGDERKRAVTIGHLLQMRSGINFHESPYTGSPLQRLNESQGDWVAIALGEPMNAAPGELWQYNGGGVIATAAAVQSVTGEQFVTYARQKLFQPIGITTETWIRSPFNGLPHTGGGLNLRAIDLARIGYLVLREGRWNGTQVVPKSWIVESTRVHTSRPRTFAGYGTDYGYLWWLMPVGTGSTNDVMITGSGNMNQWLFVVPNLDLVVAVTGGSNQANPPDFMIREILPSVTRD
jgi:CubicO group peptidase (beta-lactamase class C family)